MKTEILPTNDPRLFADAVARAVELLRDGQVVALPTETVYGLVANAWNPAAVRHIFELKGRPAQNPVIVHVAHVEMARRCAREWPAAANKLAAVFWPGPLTLVLPRAPEIPDIVTAGGDTVGIRWPSHPFIHAVLRACDFPLAAPSANRSNHVSPTHADHVRKDFDSLIPLIVNGGQSQVGIESTVFDLTCSPPAVLRPGMIAAEALLAALADTELPAPARASATLRSPGLLIRHYSPKARLVVLQWRDEEELGALLSAQAVAREKTHVLAYRVIPMAGHFGGVSVIPHDAEAYARALYAELHKCDEAGAELIVVETPPAGAEWRGIADRLNRAAGDEK